MSLTASDEPRPWRQLLAFAASLRGQLWLLWLFILLLSAFMTAILVGLYQSGSAVQIDAARRTTRATCQSIASLYVANAAQRGSMEGDLLTVMVSEVLADAAGVEGGVWDRERGFIAYAFPTHEGATAKVDVPAAETPWIVEQASKALSSGAVTEEIRRGARDALLLAACPLHDQSPHRVAWTMTRVRTASSEAFDRLTWGLALLLGFALVSGGWLAIAMSRWSRGITYLEDALQTHPVDRLPPLERRGHPDIDRIVEALNAFTHRLAAAREESSALTGKLVHAERLAALGRIAAGIVHEIRNPIGAMRLKAENALVHSPERQRDALEVILGQIDRLNDLCESLLSLARPLRLDARDVAVAAWLEERLHPFKDQAEAEGVTLRSSSEVGEARFDSMQFGRALDNLVLNALQHTPPGGQVDVSIRKVDTMLRVTVADTGSGISDAVRGTLFEPFASDRSGGTGLGLAIAREIAEAHGGTIRVAPTTVGATLEMEIPWRAS